MTFTEKIIKENLLLKETLQKAYNWIMVDNDMVEFYSVNEETASDICTELNNVISLTELVPPNQTDLFTVVETDSPILSEEVKSTIFNCIKILQSNHDCINSISKDSLIMALGKVNVISLELIEDLSNKRLKL